MNSTTPATSALPSVLLSTKNLLSTNKLISILVITFVTAVAYLARRPQIPSKAPKLVSDNYPVLGAVRFFIRRWDFMRAASSHSKSGNYSFHVAKNHVVGVNSVSARSAFFESKSLDFNSGYALLFNTGPPVHEEAYGSELDYGEGTSAFGRFFNRRVIQTVRRENLVKALPILISDCRTAFKTLAKADRHITDPYESFYNLVYQLTIRILGCKEIAEDPALRANILEQFKRLDEAGTPLSVIFPWLPTWSQLQGTLAGGRLYYMIRTIVNERKNSGIREDDPLQWLIDQGDDVMKITTFIVGGLFVGQINSGINVSHVIQCLSASPYWRAEILEEIRGVADRHAPVAADATLEDIPSLADRLATIPFDAWENEFPLLYCCFKESIRLKTVGALFRRNAGDSPVALDDAGLETIPPGAYATYHPNATHQDPEIYPNPLRWDPSRYLPDRQEDTKIPYGYLGWGAGKHPCLGIRFAKLEANVVVALWVAMFESQLCDQDGKEREMREGETVDLQSFSAGKPKEKIWIKYWPREI